MKGLVEKVCSSEREDVMIQRMYEFFVNDPHFPDIRLKLGTKESISHLLLIYVADLSSRGRIVKVIGKSGDCVTKRYIFLLFENFDQIV